MRWGKGFGVWGLQFMAVPAAYEGNLCLAPFNMKQGPTMGSCSASPKGNARMNLQNSEKPSVHSTFEGSGSSATCVGFWNQPSNLKYARASGTTYHDQCALHSVTLGSSGWPGPEKNP